MTQTIRAASLANFADLARSVGLDPLRLLDAVRIPRAALENPDLRLSASAVRDLFELSSRNAEDFTLRLVERRSLAVLGPLLLVLREQLSVRAAVHAVVRYHGIHNEASIWQVEEQDDLATIRFVMQYETPGATRQVAEAGLYQMQRCMRLFLGPGWQPLCTYLIHAPPASIDTHRRIFGPDILFNQDFHGFTVRRSDLDAPNMAADPEIARQMETYAQGFVRSLEADVTTRVRALVTGLLPIGHCNIGVVANQMTLDPRTLQRQLAQADTSFVTVVQDVRLALAVDYLEESDRPLAEVADLLGFSALSAFSRWHRTHCGVSPNERRAGAKSRRRSDEAKAS